MNFGTYGIRPTHKKVKFPNFHEFSMYLARKFISETRILAVFGAFFNFYAAPSQRKIEKNLENIFSYPK